MTRRRITPLLVTLALGAAACSSGDSAITAGNDPDTVADTADDAGDETGDDAGDDAGNETSDGDGTGDTGDETGDDATTTTMANDPLADLPACPTDALAAAGGPVEILFWHGLNVDNEDALVALVNAYNTSQDAVVVTLENQGSYLDTIDKYYQSGDDSRPDVVMFPEYGMRQAIDSGTIVPAAACLADGGFDTSAFQSTPLQAYATEGVQWAMPFNVSNPVLFYNKAMFAEAGLDPEAPPRSFDELRTMSQAIVDSGAAAYGISLESGSDSGGGWFLEQYFANLGVLYADNDNGRSAPATEVLFDSPEAVAMLTDLQSLVTDGLAVYVGGNATGTDQFFKMADPTEPSAMTIGTSAGLGTVLNALGSGLVQGLTRDDIGVGPLPGPSGEPSAIVGGAALYVVDGGDDATIAAAWDLITYLDSAEVQAEWAVATGYLPLRDDALELEPLATTLAEDARFRVAYDQLANNPDVAAAGPLLGPHRQIRTATSDAMAAIFGGADVASTLAGAVTQANAFLADYNARN